MVDFYGKLVDKYFSPMDSIGYGYWTEPAVIRDTCLRHEDLAATPLNS